MFKQYLANPCRAMRVLPAVFIGTPLQRSRVNSYFVWMLYKDILVDFLFPFCNYQCSQGIQGLSVDLLCVSHLAQLSVTATLTDFDLIPQDKCGLAGFN